MANNRNTRARRTRLLRNRNAAKVMPFNMAELFRPALTENLGDGNYRTLPLTTEE